MEGKGEGRKKTKRKEGRKERVGTGVIKGGREYREKIQKREGGMEGKEGNERV